MGDTAAVQADTEGRMTAEQQPCQQASDNDKSICDEATVAAMRTKPQSAPKELASNEWFKQSAAIEGDSEVGAGLPPFESAPVEVWRDLGPDETPQAGDRCWNELGRCWRTLSRDWYKPISESSYRGWQRRVSAAKEEK